MKGNYSAFVKDASIQQEHDVRTDNTSVRSDTSCSHHTKSDDRSLDTAVQAEQEKEHTSVAHVAPEIKYPGLLLVSTLYAALLLAMFLVALDMVS